MDTMRGALERAKMLVGMEVDEESALPPPEEQSFFDDINRHCTLNTTQASTDPSAHSLSPRRSGGGSRFAALFLLRYRHRNFGASRGRIARLEQCGPAV